MLADGYNIYLMSIQSCHAVRISPDVLFKEVSGEMVLLDLKSEKYFGLDAVGTRIWTLLQTGCPVGEVVDRLLEVFDVDRATLEADLAELLEQLAGAGLIKLHDES